MVFFQRLLWAAFAAALFLSPAHAAYDVGDIICETSTTTGTGTLNLGGAVTNYATFISQITSGSSVNYHITASDGTLETGVGVLTDATPDTLTRVAYWSTDGSGAELTLPAGTHTVCLGPTTQMFAGMKGFQLYTDDAGAVGGILPFWHDSASAADGDIAGEIQVWGGADDEEIGQIRMEVDDGATTTEDTQWQFVNRLAGSDLTALTLGTISPFTGFGEPTNIFDMGSQDLPATVIKNTSAGTSGPGLVLYADSATPAASDIAGAYYAYGEDSAGNAQQYSRLATVILDPTSTSEDSDMRFRIQSAGSNLDALTLGTTTDVGSLFGHVVNLGSSEFGLFELTSTATGAGGPGLAIYQDSATPAAVDEVGFVNFYGEDSAGNVQQYAGIAGEIIDTTSTSEDGKIDFKIFNAGSAVVPFVVGGTGDGDRGLHVGQDGSVVYLEAQSNLRFVEGEANGDNYNAMVPAAAITTNATCTFENDANFIPDSCVGDGSDASDARLKDVIGPAGDVGGMIDGIKIYDYKWNTDAADESEDIRKGKHGFGPIAQELFNLNADFVDVGGDDPLTDPWTWKPEKVVPYLIVETQNLRKRVKALEARTNPTCYGIKLGDACIGVSM
jgi:hypothetical protein